MIQALYPLSGYVVSWQMDGLSGRQTVKAALVAVALLVVGQDIQGNPKQALIPMVLWEGNFKLVQDGKVEAAN